MNEHDDQQDWLHPEPPDREIPPREAMVMTIDFLKSDFYRFVWYPRYLYEKDLADLNCRKQKEPSVRLQWLDRRDALVDIEEYWLIGWLNPPSQTKEV